MTCKKKVNKTPVHRLSSFYNVNFNAIHPKIQQDTRRTVPPTNPVVAFSQTVGQATAKLVTAQIFGRFKNPATTGLERPADVSDDAERALRERIQQRRLAQAQPPRGRAWIHVSVIR